jgi:hypothetical protein
VVGGGVAARVARPQQAGHRLSAAAASVIDEPHQRVVAEGLLPCRGRILLVGVRLNEHAVQVHDHLAGGVRGRRTGQLPHAFTDQGSRGADRGQGLGSCDSKGVDEAGDGRVGGHRAEHGRFGSQHGDVCEAVPAECDRDGHIQKDLSRIVHRPRTSPRRKRCRYRLVQAGLADCLDQQHPAGLRDDPAATAPDADTRVGSDTLLHLGSASDGGRNKDFDNPHSCWSEALFAYLITHRTARFMKARGLGLYQHGHRSARRTVAGFAEGPARGQPRLRPARRHLRRVRQGRPRLARRRPLADHRHQT